MLSNQIPLTFEVSGKTRRLDVFLSEVIAELSRRRARELCEQGLVQVNGCREKPGTMVRDGDKIQLEQLPQAPKARPELATKNRAWPELVPILFEDEHLICVAKPRMMPSVTLRAEDPLTLADCVAAHCAQCVEASKDPREAGLVQRLDFFTSGAVLAAKTPQIWELLHQALMQGQIRKTYQAMVEGKLKKKNIRIEFALVQSNDGTKMELKQKSSNARGKESFSAQTQVISSAEFYAEQFQCWVSLVQAIGYRVRRHQIRAHLAAIGHALLGDELYGSRFSEHLLVNGQETSRRPGFFLHADSISLIHPITGENLRIDCSSPEWDR